MKFSFLFCDSNLIVDIFRDFYNSYKFISVNKKLNMN